MGHDQVSRHFSLANSIVGSSLGEDRQAGQYYQEKNEFSHHSYTKCVHLDETVHPVDRSFFRGVPRRNWNKTRGACQGGQQSPRGFSRDTPRLT